MLVTPRRRGRPPTKPDSVPGKSMEDLRSEAYIMLEITPAQVASAPRIEHLFRGLGGEAPGNRFEVWQYLEGSEEPEARQVIALRDRISQRHQLAVPFEAYCVAAGIGTKKMFGIIAAEVSEQENKAAALMLRAAHPVIVDATIRRATGPLGTADAKMLLQGLGTVPVPKNSVTHIHGNVDARQQSVNVALPPVEEGVRRLSDRFNTGMPAPPMIEASVVEVDEDDGEGEEE